MFYKNEYGKKGVMMQQKIKKKDKRNLQAEIINDDMGLDCSGQGECQPNIEPSDTDEMQQVLVRANKIKRYKLKKQAK